MSSRLRRPKQPNPVLYNRFSLKGVQNQIFPNWPSPKTCPANAHNFGKALLGSAPFLQCPLQGESHENAIRIEEEYESNQNKIRVDFGSVSISFHMTKFTSNESLR